MIKIRVQCLPEHIGRTKASIEKNFKIHSISQTYPMKDSDFVRFYIEATPISVEQTIRVESVMDIIRHVSSKFLPDMKTSAVVDEIRKEIYMAVESKFIGNNS